MKKIKLLVALCCSSFVAFANNLSISTFTVNGSNLSFNVSWENSWNITSGPANWDAVWLFVKYQDCSNGLWKHADLSTNATDHSVTAPLQVDAVADGKGVFVRRSAAGSGNISNNAVTLKLNIPAGTYNFKVMGIEMINIPQNAFDLGDGISGNTFNSISINAASQSGGVTSSTLGGGAVNLPNTYPMGYNSMYCMKYEITQEQYVDFLNTLTYDQQLNRVAIIPNSTSGNWAMTNTTSTSRNFIKINTAGVANTTPAIFGCNANNNNVFNEACDGQSIACNYLSWQDLLAYLDWSALRPMTELEFEKTCRGPLARIAGEYPWGNTTINPVTTINNNACGNETSNTSGGNCNYMSYFQGPLRAGFLATGTSTRSSAGATYYGLLEMGGNVSELAVSTSNSTASAYTGALGNGILTTSGNADAANWPITTAGCAIGRGGNWDNNSGNLSYTIAVSYRVSGSFGTGNRYNSYGGRGVR